MVGDEPDDPLARFGAERGLQWHTARPQSVQHQPSVWVSEDFHHLRIKKRVQHLCAEGVTQAVFPEGGLSLNGQVGQAKLGLLSYILQGYEPGHRDIVFVPVGIAYDRVLEDNVLVEAAQKGERKFRGSIWNGFGFVVRMIRRKMQGRYTGFGMAAVSFGAPVSLADWLTRNEADAAVLGAALMASVAEVVPALPVPLVATALRAGAMDRAALVTQVTDLASQLAARGVPVELPDGGAEAAVTEALAQLLARRIVVELNGLQIAQGKADLLAFQAGSVEQHLRPLA